MNAYSLTLDAPQPQSLPVTVGTDNNVLADLAAVYGTAWPAILELFETFPELWASGSRVAAAVLRNDRLCRPDSDLDLYLISLDARRAVAAVAAIITALPEWEVEWADRGFVARLTHPEIEAPLGLMWADQHRCVGRLLDDHDLSHLQVAWRPGQVTSSSAFQTYLETGVSVLTRDALYSRVEKALAAGVPVSIAASRQALKVETYHRGHHSDETVPFHRAIVEPPVEQRLQYAPLPDPDTLEWYVPTLRQQLPDAYEMVVAWWAAVLLALHPRREEVSVTVDCALCGVHRDHPAKEHAPWEVAGALATCSCLTATLSLTESTPAVEPTPAPGESVPVILASRVGDRVYLVTGDPEQPGVAAISMARGSLFAAIEDGRLSRKYSETASEYTYVLQCRGVRYRLTEMQVRGMW